MVEPVLRTARPDDCERLIDFWAVAGENDGRPEDRPDLVARLLEHDPASVILAEVDGELVGTVVAGWDGWRANLYRLAVAPHLRRRGLARRLLVSAEERLAALGAERASAMVLEHNLAGQAVWRAHGYSGQDEWRRWVRPLNPSSSA